MGDAASPVLRSFALQEDGRLIGAYVRFLESKEHLLRENDSVTSSAERKLSQSLLLPMGRALATNWTNGNRREAGVFLRHIGASGPTASDIVSTTSRQMKKIDPVRMLEGQMASLRQSYENWVDDTPELETDFPSEDEMAGFEYAEKAHKDQFAKLEHRASQFSQTLGVFGKLSSKKLGPALNGFIREGVRFSFSNLDSSGEDTMVLGSRLSFLLLLSKYANWAKKNRKHKTEIQEYVDGLETEMRNHEEYDDVHVDDLDALVKFRDTVGLKNLPMPKSGASVMSARSGASVMSARSAASGRSTRSGVSVASARSGVSGVSATTTRTGISEATTRTGISEATGTSVRSVASARSDISAASGVSDNNGDGDESLDSVSVLPSPASSAGGRSGGSRTSRASRLSSILPTLPEGEKEESPQDDGSESDTHFSESPGNSSGNFSASPGNISGKKRSQSTYEHSDDDESVASSNSHISSE